MATDATRAADEAAEAMRRLNYATLLADGAPGLECPADVDRVLASLQIMHEREMQALGQIERWLHEQHQAGHVGHDQGMNPETAVRDVRTSLSLARGHADHAARYLGKGHNASAHLTGVEP